VRRDPRRGWAAGTLALCAWTWSLPTPATVPVDGNLLADRDCPATVSIRQGDTADGVRLEPGRAYRVLGKNKADATHCQVVVEDARPPERWVALACGDLTERGATNGDPAAAQVGTAPAAAVPARSKPGAYVLALSWQPAFCELHRSKPECRSQAAGCTGASRFSVHGLWPQPRENTYCGVEPPTRRLDEAGNWSALPVLTLRPDTRKRLATLMPGYRSGLEQHEWYSHGTCYGTDADAYFGHAMDLTSQVNASPVLALFVDHRGSYLSAARIRAAFDAALGSGTGDRVRLVCEQGMIGELRLSLQGEIAEGTRIASLMQAARPSSPGCRGGNVDEPGLD
jgi:ribonuclease T2